jgi:hypothetical protein
MVMGSNIVSTLDCRRIGILKGSNAQIGYGDILAPRTRSATCMQKENTVTIPKWQPAGVPQHLIHVRRLSYELECERQLSPLRVPKMDTILHPH